MRCYLVSMKNKINREIHKLITNKYFPEIPVKQIGIILASFGLDTDFLNGIYCGRQGETSEMIPNSKIFFRMTWYRMESGNYEIVAYVS